jgi:hydrogenase 3 maturation protease
MKLKKFLNNSDKLVILGIGNELRGDDFLGSLLARRLSKLFKEKNNIVVIDGGTVPENYTGAIKKENPDNIILIDAADMGKEPGYIRIIEHNEIANYHLSTHAMPLSFLVKYLEHSTKADIVLIGIQPKELEFVCNISMEIKKSMEYLVNIFLKILIK